MKQGAQCEGVDLPMGWCRDAVAIVDGLFPVSGTSAWDALLDLRVGLMAGGPWDRVIDAFLLVRDALELDHYLPIFRLRRLLASGLRLELVGCGETGDLTWILNRPARSFADLERLLRREAFEHQLDFLDPVGTSLGIIEMVGSTR